MKKEDTREVVSDKGTQVKFTVTDGKRPTRVEPSGVFNLRAPTGLQIRPGAEVVVRSGVYCDFPVHVFETTNVAARGARLVDGVWAAHDADTEITVRMRNMTEEDVTFEEGETLARFAIFDNTNVRA